MRTFLVLLGFFLTGITVPIQGGLLDGTDSLDLDSSGKLSNML